MRRRSMSTGEMKTSSAVAATMAIDRNTAMSSSTIAPQKPRTGSTPPRTWFTSREAAPPRPAKEISARSRRLLPLSTMSTPTTSRPAAMTHTAGRMVAQSVEVTVISISVAPVAVPVVRSGGGGGRRDDLGGGGGRVQVRHHVPHGRLGDLQQRVRQDAEQED